MKVDLYSHGFRVSHIEPRLEGLVKEFGRKTAEFETVKDPETGFMESRIVKMWSYAPVERDSFNFHIYYWNEFKGRIDNDSYATDVTKIVDHRFTIDKAKDAKFKVKEIHTPRDYQEQLISTVVNGTDNSYCITLPPGAGKTLVAMHVMSRIKKRTFITMKGGYLDRWTPDLVKAFDLKKGGLLEIRGQKDLINLMEMEEAGELNAEIIIATVDTVDTFIKDYEKYPHIRERYPFGPRDFFEGLKIGLMVIDEGHQNPHKLMRVFTYTNIPKVLTLSATVETRDPFLNKRYQILYPRSQRHDAGYTNVYIGVNALKYGFDSIKGIRTTGYQGAYSHLNFESSLMKGHNRRKLANYLGLVKYSIDLLFMKDYKPKTKCLVFFATVKMCDNAVKYLKGKYPNLKVSRYTAKDKMDAFEADIIVSTVLSAGTAVDIVDLRTTIMTTAIDSQIANDQSLGRTRPVKSYPELTPEFNYFVCDDIPKHDVYHRNKKKAFKHKVKYHNEIYLPYKV